MNLASIGILLLALAVVNVAASTQTVTTTHGKPLIGSIGSLTKNSGETCPCIPGRSAAQ